MAGLVVAEEFDAGFVKSANQFHQRVDVSSNDALPGLHSLDRRYRETGKTGQFTLIYSKKGSGGPQLRCRDHELSGVVYCVSNRDYKICNPYNLMSTLTIDRSSIMSATATDFRSVERTMAMQPPDRRPGGFPPPA